jgi:hypothetical protein
MAANNNPTEVLAGLVERVTFHNEDNGFCVLRVARGKREPITVVGHAAVISAGEFIHKRTIQQVSDFLEVAGRRDQLQAAQVFTFRNAVDHVSVIDILVVAGRVKVLNTRVAVERDDPVT